MNDTYRIKLACEHCTCNILLSLTPGSTLREFECGSCRHVTKIQPIPLDVLKIGGFSMRVVEDPSLPPDTMELRSGTNVVRVVGLSAGKTGARE